MKLLFLKLFKNTNKKLAWTYPGPSEFGSDSWDDIGGTGQTWRSLIVGGLTGSLAEYRATLCPV
jgi:hypothetical protein